jgi:acetylornithine deacetylase
MNPAELLKNLINIPSVTGEEAQIGLFLNELLKKAGFNVLIQTVEGSRNNLFADTGSPSKIVLCTHMDTVPPFIPASEDEQTIYGRGACDAKGSLAAMLTAAQELIEEGENRFGLLFVIGEEGNSIGAKTANELKIHSEFIIVGEPTKNKLASAHKGIVWMRLIAKGKTSHSAYPDLGDSAVDKLLNALEFIRQIDLSENSDSGNSTINIGRIEGGLSANMVPGSASAEIVVRCVEPVHDVIQKISAGVKSLVEVKIISRSDPQKLYTVPNIEQTVVPFGTDIPHLKTFGKPLLLGPGEGVDAHTETEKVQKSQLREAVLLYKQLVRQLLG